MIFVVLVVCSFARAQQIGVQEAPSWTGGVRFADAATPESVSGPNPRTMVLDEANGAVYVVGTTERLGGGNSIAVWKYSETTGALLASTYWPPDWDSEYKGDFSGITIAQNGAVYAVGVGPGDGTGLDFWCVKFSKNLDVRHWVGQFNAANGDDVPAQVAIRTTGGAGGVYVGGTCTTGSGGSQDWAIVNFDDQTGQVAAWKDFGGPYADRLVDMTVVDIVQAGSGGISHLIATGTVYDAVAPGSGNDYFTVAYVLNTPVAPNFQLAWVYYPQNDTRYHFERSDVPAAIALGHNSQTPPFVVVTGTSERQVAPNVWTTDIATVAYRASDGSLLWSNRWEDISLTGSQPAVARRVWQEPHSHLTAAWGNYVFLAGGSLHPTQGYNRTTVAVNPDTGAFVWQRIEQNFGNTANEYNNDVVVVPGLSGDWRVGGVYQTGVHHQSGNHRIRTQRVDRTAFDPLIGGLQRWAIDIDTSGNDAPTTLRVIPHLEPHEDYPGINFDLSRIFINGRAQGGVLQSATMKYEQFVIPE